MVDVMLVLLIIFMVITPMLTKGVSVDMVKTKNPIAMQAADKEDAVLVAVTRDGEIYLGTTPMAAGPVAAEGEGSADEQAGQDRATSRAMRAPGTRGWWKWWTTCAPPAWISWDLLTEQIQQKDKAPAAAPAGGI